MNIKLTNLSLFLFITINIFSQEKTIIIEGKIMSSNKRVENAHIYNLSKKIGSISNEEGLFKIKASASDTLYISSLEYEKLTFILSEKNLINKNVEIELIPIVNELDEVFLKHLTGDLNFDLANKPIDTVPPMGWVYSKKDLYSIPQIDENDATTRADPVANTNPISGGAGATLPDRRLEALYKLKRELKQKKEFPEIIKRELGIKYFTITLKIPEESINNFLSYCEYRDIIHMYFNNKQLEVISILKEESKKYNEIKN